MSAIPGKLLSVGGRPALMWLVMAWAAKLPVVNVDLLLMEPSEVEQKLLSGTLNVKGYS